MSELRCVIDTSVVVSALLVPNSLPRKAFDAAVAEGRLLVSLETIAELDEVLRRRKFDRFVPEPLRLEFLAALVRVADLIEVKDELRVCRDPKDDKFLSLAVTGGANNIISGDLDLLVLHPFRQISVVTPKQFLDNLGSRAQEP